MKFAFLVQVDEKATFMLGEFFHFDEKIKKRLEIEDIISHQSTPGNRGEKV